MKRPRPHSMPRPLCCSGSLPPCHVRLPLAAARRHEISLWSARTTRAWPTPIGCDEMALIVAVTAWRPFYLGRPHASSTSELTCPRLVLHHARGLCTTSPYVSLIFIQHPSASFLICPSTSVPVTHPPTHMGGKMPSCVFSAPQPARCLAAVAMAEVAVPEVAVALMRSGLDLLFLPSDETGPAPRLLACAHP